MLRFLTILQKLVLQLRIEEYLPNKIALPENPLVAYYN